MVAITRVCVVGAVLAVVTACSGTTTNTNQTTPNNLPFVPQQCKDYGNSEPGIPNEGGYRFDGTFTLTGTVVSAVADGEGMTFGSQEVASPRYKLTIASGKNGALITNASRSGATLILKYSDPGADLNCYTAPFGPGASRTGPQGPPQGLSADEQRPRAAARPMYGRWQ